MKSLCIAILIALFTTMIPASSLHDASAAALNQSVATGIQPQDVNCPPYLQWLCGDK